MAWGSFMRTAPEGSTGPPGSRVRPPSVLRRTFTPRSRPRGRAPRAARAGSAAPPRGRPGPDVGWGKTQLPSWSTTRPPRHHAHAVVQGLRGLQVWPLSWLRRRKGRRRAIRPGAIEGEPEGDDLAVLDVVGVAVSAAVGGIRLDPHPQLAPGLAPVRGALVDGGEPRLSVAPGWGPEIQWQSQSPLGAMVRAGPMARGQAAPKVCRERFSIRAWGAYWARRRLARLRRPWRSRGRSALSLSETFSSLLICV